MSVRGMVHWLSSAVVCVVFCCACGRSFLGETHPPIQGLEDPQVVLPWPPGEQNVRQTSDDTIELMGIDYSAAGNKAIPNGYPTGSLRMQGTIIGPLPWVIYSLGGFREEPNLASVTVNSSLIPNPDPDPPPSDEPQLYFGIGNYAKQGWEWYLADSPEYIFTLADADDADYISPGQSVHIALVLVGLDDCIIESLVFERVGDTSLMPPNNLSAIPHLGSIDISWEQVPNAEEYHVYRAEHKSLPNPVWLTDGNPVVGLSYTDETVERGIMYYYYVVAVLGPTISPPSDYIDIFSPQMNRDMPYDLGSYSYGRDDFTVTWDWPIGDFPVYFRVYYSTVPDFNLTGEDETTFLDIPGHLKVAKLDLKDVEEDVYWRVCTLNEVNLGKMTDDIFGEFIPIWEWEEVELIAVGVPPFTVIDVEGDIALAYIYLPPLPQEWSQIRMGRRTDGEWNLDSVVMPVDVGNYVAMAYSNGEYVLATQSTRSHDLWVAVGQPGGWSPLLLDGDGDTSMVHPINGIGCKAAANDSEFVVVHSRQDTTDDPMEIMAHTLPVGANNWNEPEVLWQAHPIWTHMSLAAKDDNIYLLWFDDFKGDLLFADHNSSWQTRSVLNPETLGYGQFNNLTWFNDEWWTTAYHPLYGYREMYILHGTDNAWRASLHKEPAMVGEWAVMAATETKMVVAYYRRYSDNWELAVYDGQAWQSQALIIPNVQFSRVGLGFVGDLPYLIVDNPDWIVEEKTVTGLEGRLMIPPE